MARRLADAEEVRSQRCNKVRGIPSEHRRGADRLASRTLGRNGVVQCTARPRGTGTQTTAWRTPRHCHSPTNARGGSPRSARGPRSTWASNSETAIGLGREPCPERDSCSERQPRARLIERREREGGNGLPRARPAIGNRLAGCARRSSRAPRPNRRLRAADLVAGPIVGPSRPLISGSNLATLRGADG
jgi:hypothetical protein